METKIYNIDSSFRNLTKYPNSSNFTYNILDNVVNSSAQVIPFNEKNVIGMKILSIEIPNTMYFINSTKGNNTFLVDGTPYIVPSGSYTITDLIDKLNALVIILQFSLIPYEGKVIILSNDPSNHTIEFPSITTGYQSFGQLLGFINNSYIVTSTDATGENALIIPQEQYFFLRLNDLGNIINNNTKYVAKLYILVRFLIITMLELDVVAETAPNTPTWSFNGSTEAPASRITLNPAGNRVVVSLIVNPAPLSAMLSPILSTTGVLTVNHVYC